MSSKKMIEFWQANGHGRIGVNADFVVTICDVGEDNVRILLSVGEPIVVEGRRYEVAERLGFEWDDWPDPEI